MEALARQTSATPRGALKTDLWNACRAQARPALDELAQRIEMRAAWDDLVLPEPQKEHPARDRRAGPPPRTRSTRAGASPSAAAAAWASARCSPAPSGTGKTMAAEVLANCARPRPVPHRPRVRRQQVHRRDGEEPAAASSTPPRRRRDPALRRGRRPLRQAQRGQGQPRPLRQHRGQLSAAAHGGVPRPGHPDDQHAEGASTAAFLRRIRFVVQFPVPGRRAARRDLARRLPARATPTEGLDLHDSSPG